MGKTMPTSNSKKAECEHYVAVLRLGSGGHMSVCLKCRKVLRAPKDHGLEPEEIQVLIDFAKHVTEFHKAKKDGTTRSH